MMQLHVAQKYAAKFGLTYGSAQLDNTVFFRAELFLLFAVSESRAFIGCLPDSPKPDSPKLGFRVMVRVGVSANRD